jgi:hypothetical protein
MTYIPPKVYASKFTCPQCVAIAKQSWQSRMSDFRHHGDNAYNVIPVGTCDHTMEGHLSLTEEIDVG